MVLLVLFCLISNLIGLIFGILIGNSITKHKTSGTLLIADDPDDPAPHMFLTINPSEMDTIKFEQVIELKVDHIAQ